MLFPNKETLNFHETLPRVQTPKFRVEFLEEAAEFLERLEDSARDKIIYNITKARYSNNKELFKKLTDEIWELERYLTRPITGFSRSGTNQRKSKQLLCQLMD